MALNLTKSFKVERFNGKENFILWQTRVHSILVLEGLAIALKGKDCKPEHMSAKEWEDIESRCISIVRFYLADNIIRVVRDEDTALGLWEKLERLYKVKSSTARICLKLELYQLRLREGGNLTKHINVFKGILTKLANLDVHMKEEDKAILLLCSLPRSYGDLITIIVCCRKTLNLDDVEAILLYHDNVERYHATDSQMVLHGHKGRGRSRARGCNESRRSKSRGQKGKQCYKCHEWGHIRKNCPT